VPADVLSSAAGDRSAPSVPSSLVGPASKGPDKVPGAPGPGKGPGIPGGTNTTGKNVGVVWGKEGATGHILSTGDGTGTGGWGLGDGYAGQALWLIEQNFRPPYSAPTKAVLQFKILPDGTIDPESIAIRTSTGRPDLDQSAVRALKITNKLPPLYDEYAKSYMEVTVTFDYDRKL